jgi:RNA polymerase sigma-70 factor (ECF subfamily)
MGSKNPVPGISVDPINWVNEYGNGLLRYALSFVRNKTVADDLVQETFLAALTSRSAFTGKSSEKTWLFGILRHKAIDYLRKCKTEYQTERREELDFVESTRELPALWRKELIPTDWRSDPNASAQQAAFWGILNSCLAGLSPRMANAFTLREIEGMSAKEICEVLDLTESNYWVVLFRARTILRRCIEKKWFCSS